MALIEYESPFHVTHSEEVANKMMMKMDLSIFITSCIKSLELNQSEAAQRLGVTQSRISELANGKIEKFTIDAMMDMLDKLGFKVGLVLPENSKGSGPCVQVAMAKQEM